MEHQDVTDSEGSVRALHPGIALDPSISDAWRQHLRQRTATRAAVIDLVLPSTLPIKAMRMPLQYLFRHGMIPDPLTAIIQEHIAILEKPDTATEAMMANLEANPVKAERDWLTVLQTVWTACVVQPSFTDDEAQVGRDGEPFYVGDVNPLDLLYVYQWAQGVDESVAEFLHQQAEIMDRLSKGESVSDTAKHLLRSNRQGGRVARVYRGQRDVSVGLDGGAVAAGDDREASPEQASEEPDDGRAKVRTKRDRANDPRTAPRDGRKTRRTGGTTAIIPPAA
jgi:hypothetical protein